MILQAETSVTPLRFATIKDLTRGGKATIAETAKNLVEELAGSKTKGIFRLSLIAGKEKGPAVYDVPLGRAKAKGTTKASAKPTVELITTSETWIEIASGRLAPHDAFLGGRMRVRGNAFTAQRLLKYLAGSEGRTFLCREK
jgi:putative sterol carrier protein